MKRMREADERQSAEKTLRKLESDLVSLEQFHIIRRGSDHVSKLEERREITAQDIDNIWQHLLSFQRNHERIQLQLLQKQELIPKIKEDIDSLDDENELLR